jgi:competence protein ComEA
MDTHPPNPAPEKVWPRSAQWATVVLLIAAVGLLACNAVRSTRWGTQATTLRPGDELAYRIDINQADRAELLQIPGVGPALAERIEAHRLEHGPFPTVDDLRHVHGIGPAILERIRPWVCVHRASEEEYEAKPPTTRIAYYAGKDPLPDSPANPASKKKAVVGSVRIDVNRATAAELQQLPGIGPKISQRIIDEREKRPFASVDELRRVSGIGAKTLDKLRPFVTVETPAPPTVRDAAADER